MRWRIRDGLLVAQEGREADGYLEIDVQRCADESPGRARVHVEVEIASFYPAIAFRIARWFYANTQSRIHVLVTHGFLRSLARLELEESAVGRFVERPAAAGGEPRTGARPSPSATRRGRCWPGSRPWSSWWAWRSPRAAASSRTTRSARAACGGRGGSGCAGPSRSASA